jgi:hypothetical protein
MEFKLTLRDDCVLRLFAYKIVSLVNGDDADMSRDCIQLQYELAVWSGRADGIG